MVKVCGLTLISSFVLATFAIHVSRPSEAFAIRVPTAYRRTLSGKRVAADRRLTRIKLGEALYFDRRLSVDATVSCATCHDPAAAFASKDTVAIGAGNQIGTRNAPTVLNAVFSQSYFWDGRVDTLEEQAKQPLLNLKEMGMKTDAALVSRVSSISEYRINFHRVFPREGITLDTIARAIAAYERTLISRNSPFDRFIAGDKKAITEIQENGWNLFKGKARCIECHAFSASSPFFTDYKFYNTGVAGKGKSIESLTRAAEQLTATGANGADTTSLAHQDEFTDLGRFLVTRQSRDIGAFKTPTLRDIELTGPYMHNGSFKTLLDVVRFYNQGGEKNPNLDQKMRPLNLTDEEMSNIVEFLRTLTSDDVLRMTQTATPQSRIVSRMPLKR